MNFLLTRISQHWLLLSGVCLALITLASLYPAEHLPKVPGSDKTHHFISYALLMFPAGLAKPKHWLLIALFFIGWSGMIEIIQPYMNRYGEWLDLAANAGGVCIGFIMARMVDRFLITSGR